MTLHQAAGLGARPARPFPARARPPRAVLETAVLGVVSGKGGVGKSTLSVNLVAAAARSGARALLLDGDLGLANADLLLGMVPGRDLAAWCAGECSLEQTLCRGPHGLELLVAGESVEATRRLRDAAMGREAGGLGRLFAAQDLVVLDLGAGIGDAVVELASACRPVWLLATPEPTSLADAYATAKRLWQRAPALEIELVVNRAADAAAGQRTQQALGRLIRRFLGRELPLRGVLLEDAAMARSVSRQCPVVLDASDSGVARRISLLAESLLEERRAAEVRASSASARANPVAD